MLLFFTEPIVIGYTRFSLIPENNVINIKTSEQKRGVPIDQVSLFCYTTRGYENPGWRLSTDDFSTSFISDGRSSLLLPDGSVVPITITQGSSYESMITIITVGVSITLNLVCESQSNSSFHYSIMITTSKRTYLCVVLVP